jgi:hypothetical protein
VRNPTFRKMLDLIEGRATTNDDGTVIYQPKGKASVGELPPL